MAGKLKLYLVERYYADPADTLVIASSREEAIELSNKKHGEAESTAKRLKFKKAKVLYY